MASSLTNASVGEIRATGSDSNGGFFDSSFGGTDYTLQNAAQATGTVTSVGATVTATAGIFTSAMVGNSITDGTTWTTIIAFTSSIIVTVNAAPAWTAATIRVGGALASPGQASLVKSAGNSVWMRGASGTLTVSSASANVSGGIVNDTVGGNGQGDVAHWRGYNTTRWNPTVGPTASDIANPPLIQLTVALGSGLTVMKGAAQHISFENLLVDCNANTTSVGIGLAALWNQAVWASATRATQYGIQNTTSSDNKLTACQAYNCSGFTGIYTVGPATDCASYNHTNGSHGFYIDSTTVTRCAAYNNAGGGMGFYENGNASTYVHCVAYAGTGQGFYIPGGAAINSTFVNCVSVLNSGGYGWDATTATDSVFLFNCAGYGNSSGNYNSSFIMNTFGFITLSGDPFNNGAGGDLSLNSGAGAALKAAGFPSTFPGGTTANHIDVGLAQSAAGGGTAGMLYRPSLAGVG